MRDAERDAPGVIAPPPLIYLLALGLGFAVDAALPSASPSRAVSAGVGWPLVGAGVALMASFVGAFRRAGTPVDPREPSTALVTSGPYRLSRNPGYLGMALIAAGVALLTGRLWILLTLAAAVAAVDRGVIAREERYLEAKFGDEYRRYKARTRRWL